MHFLLLDVPYFFFISLPSAPLPFQPLFRSFCLVVIVVVVDFWKFCCIVYILPTNLGSHNLFNIVVTDRLMNTIVECAITICIISVQVTEYEFLLGGYGTLCMYRFNTSRTMIGFHRIDMAVTNVASTNDCAT